MNELLLRLDAAQAAARLSGRMLTRRPSFHIENKAPRDFVTDMDRLSERTIIETLQARFPEDGFFGEEGGLRRQARGMWVIDPIDGTTNFVKDIPTYTISIAYVVEDDIKVGVVYAPALDEMYTAVKGGGAFRNGAPVHVSDVSDPMSAVIGVSFVHNVPEVSARVRSQLMSLLTQVNDLRRLGSAAFDLCSVACGRLDGFVEPCLKLYDVAAGVLILREAGGIVTGWDEGEDPLKTGSIMASNGLLHDFLFQRFTLK